MADEGPEQDGAAALRHSRTADCPSRPPGGGRGDGPAGAGSGAWQTGAGWGTLALALPAWLVLGLFFLLPLVLMLGVSGAERGVYGGLRPIADLAAYLRSGAFLASYRQSLQALYLGIAWRSLWMAALTTGLCLAIGFPAAYALALHVPRRRRGLLLGLVVVPLWTSFLIRTYAWMFILRSEGLLNHLLLSTGLASRPLPMLYTGGAVIVGLVYGELPFMILPLYAALERLDRTLLEAAADLGAGRAAVVRRVTVPLALPGLVAGVVLVFVPSLGQFVVSDLLGGAHTMLLGNLIQNQFAVARNQPFGAALAFELTAAVLLLLGAARAAGTAGAAGAAGQAANEASGMTAGQPPRGWELL
jgi:spermidine/putrescine transport system permease protein